MVLHLRTRRPAACIVRSVLGDRAGREWLQGSWAGVPSLLAAHARTDWFTQWNRWQARVHEVDVDSDLARVERAGGGFVSPSDPRWPSQLSCLGDDEPLGLWYLGTLPSDSSSDGHVSIIGARASTGAGGRCARNMAYHLARSGYTVVSGGAIGIDIERAQRRDDGWWGDGCHPGGRRSQPLPGVSHPRLPSNDGWGWCTHLQRSLPPPGPRNGVSSLATG